MTAIRFTSKRARLAALMFAVAPTWLSAQGGGMLGGMGGEGLGNRPFGIAVDGGLTLANGDLKSRNENGFHFGASIIYKIPRMRVGFRPEFTYTSFRFKQTVYPSRAFGEKNYTRVLTGLGHLELPFSNGLYVFGGAGVMQLNSVIARDTTTRTGSSLMTDLGGGYRFEFGPIQSFLELRFGTAKADEKKFSYSRASILPLSFGFLF